MLPVFLFNFDFYVALTYSVIQIALLTEIAIIYESYFIVADVV